MATGVSSVRAEGGSSASPRRVRGGGRGRVRARARVTVRVRVRANLTEP